MTRREVSSPAWRQLRLDIPLIVYNPPHAKCRLSLDEIARLKAGLPMLIGRNCRAATKSGMGASSQAAGSRRLHSRHFMGERLPRRRRRLLFQCRLPEPRRRRQVVASSSEDPAGALDVEARVVASMNEPRPASCRGIWSFNAALDKAMAAAGRWCPMGRSLLLPIVPPPVKRDRAAPPPAANCPSFFSTSQ